MIKKMQDTTAISLRVDTKLLGEIEFHREQLRGLNPGMNVTASDAVRSLLKLGIAANANGKRRGKK
jgi:hypothetical protein